MRKNNIKEGLALYDELNGRYITVQQVYWQNGTALCNTEEEMYDDEAGEVTGVISDTQIFGLSELTHFKEVDAW